MTKKIFGGVALLLLLSFSSYAGTSDDGGNQVRYLRQRLEDQEISGIEYLTRLSCLPLPPHASVARQQAVQLREEFERGGMSREEFERRLSALRLIPPPFSRVLDAVSRWRRGHEKLGSVVDLINAWSEAEHDRG